MRASSSRSFGHSSRSPSTRAGIQHRRVVRDPHHPVELPPRLAEVDLGLLVVPAPVRCSARRCPSRSRSGRRSGVVDARPAGRSPSRTRADERDRRLAHRLDQLGGVACEVLDRPGHRRRRRSSRRCRGCRRSCCGSRCLKYGIWYGCQSAAQAAPAGDPHDVGAVPDLLVVDRRLGSIELRQGVSFPGDARLRIRRPGRSASEDRDCT